EAKQLKENLVDIANTKVNGKYIFNGTRTSEKPINPEAVNDEDFELKLNDDEVRIEVASGIELTANVNPKNVFGNGTTNVFNDIEKLINALEKNERTEIDDSIESLDGHIDNVINARADLGARMNRLELIEDRLEDQEIVATKIMSDNEDVDFEKVITDLITQESVHRAALSAGSRMIQPSLIDFLRYLKLKSMNLIVKTLTHYKGSGF